MYHSPSTDPLIELRVLGEREAAATLAVGVSTLRRWRIERTGPAHVRLGERRVGYRVGDLRAWLASRSASAA